MPVVFVLVDALRHDYLAYHKSAPFLSHCAEHGIHVETVKPSLGFCERVEILTGVGFPENGYLSAIGREKNGVNPYALLKVVPPFISQSRIFRKVLGRIARKLRLSLQPYEIPCQILPELGLTEDARSHQKTKAFPIESLVDVFAEAGKEISWHFAALGVNNGSDEDRVCALKKAFMQGAADLYMLYLSPLDSIAHKYGPLSEETGLALRDVDNQISELFADLKSHDPSVKLVVLGDHGMADVAQVLDAEEILRKVATELGLTAWKDYKYFLDSTTCRIWGGSKRFESNENEFIGRLERSFGATGHWLDGEWSKELYGDYIWVCGEGTLVFPDFFHKGGLPYKGMHGYDPERLSMRGLGLIYSEDGRIPSKTIPEGSLGDASSTLCALMKVRSPRESKGTSWL